MEKLIGMYKNNIEKLSKVLDKLEGTGMAWWLVNGMISGLKMVVDDLSKCVRGENLDTGDRQLTIPDVSNRYLETTNEYERLKVEIYKDLLVELYDFAYQQAKKTDSVDELLDIDRRINGC
ncbi:MAG: hypothetical protein RBT65_19170 [Methanolobus sp.]|nr:hypothetical protein [Methanolobus sp.]